MISHSFWVVLPFMFNSFSYEVDIDNFAMGFWDTIYFFSLIVIITLVMLNLLIAELNETYTRVTADTDIIDNVQLNQIILELEQYLNYWYSDDGNLQFMV